MNSYSLLPYKEEYLAISIGIDHVFRRKKNCFLFFILFSFKPKMKLKTLNYVGGCTTLECTRHVATTPYEFKGDLATFDLCRG
jgi:hypothetical protein